MTTAERIASLGLALAAALTCAGCGPDLLPPGGDDAALPDAALPDAGGEAPLDAGRDAAVADAGTRDAGAPDAGPPPVVSHPRELRGLWVTTVLNLDFPQTLSGSPVLGPMELSRIVNLAAETGFNALFFQVRPESDAWYGSSREPWSRFLTGMQGVAPGYDPLEALITLAHAKGLEVHAWVNPYRGLVSASVAAAPTHITRVLPQHAIPYGSGVVMNPAASAVQDWVVAEVSDLVGRYDVDGLHFDDYFYPYPIAGAPFPDEPSYQAYRAGGGALGKSDWRREQVNTLVRRVSQALAQLKPWVRFGISPFGIYRPGQPAGIVGLDAYEVIACDALAWLTNGWVDYVAPQLYWPSTRTGQRFDLLVAWWAQQVSAGRSIFPGLALYQLGTAPDWSVQEFRTQVRLSRAQAPRVAGNLWFRYAMLRDDVQGIRAVLRDELYARPALPPPLATQRDTVVEPPRALAADGGTALQHPRPDAVRGYAVYRQADAGWVLEQFLPGAQAVLQGPAAVTAVSRSDVESAAILVP